MRDGTQTGMIHRMCGLPTVQHSFKAPYTHPHLGPLVAVHRIWAHSEGYMNNRNRVSHYKDLHVNPRLLLSVLWPEILTENNHIAPWASFPKSLDSKPDQAVCVLCYLQPLLGVSIALHSSD